jgi:amino acid permease
MSVLDSFFNLGNKVSNGDPARKAQFDYYLYWIVFLCFVFIALADFYNFFFKGGSINNFFWGVIVLIFCWFNYFALGAFKKVYDNMKAFKKATELSKKENDKISQSEENVEDMLKLFEEKK